MATEKGLFYPKNVAKYMGKPPCIFRSGWEKKAMLWLDNNPRVVKWGSENVIIPYISPLDKDLHNYYVDFIMIMEVKGVRKTFLIEVKPKAQCSPPKADSRHPRRSKKALATWLVNEAKWKAAELLCEKKGWKFMKWTEKELDIGQDPGLTRKTK